MNWLISENKKRINIADIPVLNIEDLRFEIINLNKTNKNIKKNKLTARSMIVNEFIYELTLKNIPIS